MRLAYTIYLLAALGGQSLYPREKWTETHTYAFKARTKNKKLVIRPKKSTLLFSQLLFSWNAIRPEYGFFTFYVRAHDKHANKWGAWHRMAEWGNGIQRSFESTEDTTTAYHHVRLEMKNGHLGDNYEILIESQKNAPLCNLKFAAVTLSRLEKFKPEHICRGHKLLPEVSIVGVPKYSQLPFEEPGRAVLCSPTSLSMIVEYLCKNQVHIPTVAQHVYDDGLKIFGSWPFNTAHAFEACNHTYAFYVTRLHSFRELHALLMKGIPVEVSVRGSLPGAPKDYPHGHLLVVVGYDPKRKHVLCHDPARAEGETEARYSLVHFLRAWERSYRLAYRAQKLGD